MRQHLQQHVDKFGRKLRFFKGLMSQPKTVGAIVPTSVFMARRMASVANPASGLPVLELGPGTGVVTKAILRRGIAPEKLVSVEFSDEFCRHLKKEMPDIGLVHGDAFRLDETLGSLKSTRFDCVISGLPLLNFPVADRVKLLEDALNRIPSGRPFLQFCYGPLPPIPHGRGHYTIKRFGWEFRNIPPAQMWLYRKGEA
ncbi:phospholipid N-methyltransferase PmtA [Hoeflea prorocentri]|uniref:Methyltransferase domain-containing protein n=1 Tax=Hoeflea prorocentri TaxID=1922333 RepID=A0A9X3UM15_9HYPH|nr:methyltransferase domain-containing protein [Hoeflea prorocentri]MCY6383107.1 methyltransferase domain-containing protein [Hoeflea prorocentri]MDA5400907.1 methyltransferase domain-containing protein [Hoeflea prorocentri]